MPCPEQEKRGKGEERVRDCAHVSHMGTNEQTKASESEERKQNFGQAAAKGKENSKNASTTMRTQKPRATTFAR